ncbi:Fis family transcriptional regulator [Actinoplanes sp. SE50]|uniref:ATP-binding protein n=1 Tax=unclassified Actinoplanes TaxID=2626549 RepID=UPI00023EBCF2|nr:MULTISPECIES: ATP-binding protein [unclassified Actinoplanes]AEV82908.1 putative histidine kinase, classic [Actinoplanes sp. SE50/110]ATO81304.1 Fis family transcriptional regulator [Actinoplanes sp. SE50]SLL98711.1 Fis family transcriptional regulator [Actinoplanes sp. SE50/110]
MSRWRDRPWFRATALSALVALAGCAGSLGVGTVLRRNEKATTDVQMDRRTAAAVAAVQAETRRYVDTLRTTAASVGAQQTLQADEYAAITAPLHSMKLAGATSIALVVPAAADQVARVQQTWRDRGATGLTLHPGPSADHDFSVLVAELDGRSGTTGIDLMRAAAPAAALAESRRTRQIAVSDTYQLLVDQSLPPERRQNSFVLAAPVYRGIQQDFLGWLLLGVRGQDFMGATLNAAGPGLADLRLTANRADGQPVTVAAMRHGAGDDLRRVVDIPVADSTWTLHVTGSRRGLPGAGNALPAAVTGAGLLLSLLLTVLIWVLVTGRERARLTVRSKTAELVTEQAEVNRQAGLLRAVLDGISDGVGVVGPDGAFLLHNPAAREILGRDEEDTDGAGSWQEHFGLFRPDGTTPFPTDDMPLVQALAGERVDQVEMVVRNAAHPDGRMISVSARPVETGEGQRGAVAVFHDITERKRVETELRGFAGVVAHDLKAPLTIVTAYADLVSDALDDLAAGAGVPTLEQARHGTAKVLHGAGRMQRLITELLDYTAARDATLRVERLSLRALVDDVVTTRTDAPDQEADARPDVFVGPLPDVEADPVLLRQVVDNLVGNAIKYTPPGRAARIDITARTGADGEVRVRIADRGIGIPDGEHAAVFGTFHRASNGAAHPGTGLGLAICRRIVERHGGHIEAAPNPGGGTVFTFTLPATPPGEPSRTTPARASIPTG